MIPNEHSDALLVRREPAFIGVGKRHGVRMRVYWLYTVEREIKSYSEDRLQSQPARCNLRNS
jgi:hypothetical protein